MLPEITIAHNLTKGGGWAFVTQENGCARTFNSVEEAWEHIGYHGLDKRIWSVMILMPLPQVKKLR